MRIGLVIYNSLDTVSGGYLYDRQLVRTLREAGDEVEIISLPWSSYERHILHNARPSLVRRLRYGRYDLILQDELNHPSLYLINERLNGRISAPIVSIVHHLRASERHPARQMAGYRRLERRYLRSVDGFVYNSETTRFTAEALSGKSQPYIVAHPAADHIMGALSEREISGRSQANRPLHLIFVGNIIPRKGLHTLLAALALLPSDAWKLSIVGSTSVDDAYVGRVRKQISGSMAPRITWHGRLADEALWKRMAGADVLVVPSSYEGFGIVYLEGMAFGLPAIATTAGAAREVITDGVNGFLIAPDEVRQLAQRVVLLQTNRQILSRMSVAAMTRFRSSPTWSQTMSAVRRFLQEMTFWRDAHFM